MAIFLVGSVLAGGVVANSESTVTFWEIDTDSELNNTVSTSGSFSVDNGKATVENTGGNANAEYDVETSKIVEAETVTINITSISNAGQYTQFQVKEVGGTFVSSTKEINSTGELTLDVSNLDNSTGDYHVIVRANEDNSSITYDSIVAEGSNTAPTAEAGSNVTIDAGNSTTLDASSSSDLDGDSLTYEWQNESGEVISTNETVGVYPDSDTTYTLVVDDGYAMDSDTVTVNVESTSDNTTTTDDTSDNTTTTEDAPGGGGGGDDGLGTQALGLLGAVVIVLLAFVGIAAKAT